MEFYKFNNSTKDDYIIVSDIPNYPYQFIFNMGFSKGYSEKRTLGSSVIQILSALLRKQVSYNK